MYLKRDLEETLIKAARQSASITIYGSRQVGKSTMVRKLFKDIGYVTLDDIANRGLAVSNPKLFLQTFKYPIIIDEIQKAPQLLNEIKIIIDNKKLEWLNNGEESHLLYVLSGSNQFELQSAVSESLAGRTFVLNLASLSYNEIEQRKQHSYFDPDIQLLLEKERDAKPRVITKAETFELIFKGGMPEYITSNLDRDLYYSSYINTYIEKDVKKIISSVNEFTFLQFIGFVAYRTGSQLNYDDIARNVGVDSKTIKNWISILKTSGLIVLLEPFLSNIGNRIIKTPKLYFMDTGLAAYLCRWGSAKQLEESQMAGAFYETYVVSEIVKSYYNAGIDIFNFGKQHIYYYRDKDKKEVDLIIDTQDGIYPIEIKKGVNPVNYKINFDFLKKYNINLKPGLVVHCGDRILPINEEVYYCPTYMIGL